MNEDNHQHSHSYRRLEKKRLLITIIITAVVMIVEIAGGILSKSLALISDAGHMFTHSFALLVSFFAIMFATKKPTQEKSFGFYRAEILAALFNGMALLVVSGFIVWEAVKRIMNPSEINVMEMIIISIIGLAANIASAVVLSGASKKSINLRSAFVHMIGDTASSVAIVIGAVIIYFTGFYLIDPIFSILICIVILYWAFLLIRDSVRILMEITPKSIDIKKMTDELMAQIPELKGLHDIHIWGITDDMNYITAHAVVGEDIYISNCNPILDKMNEILIHDYNIGHSTIQFETAECRPHKYNFRDAHTHTHK